jgi:hypothetical protein
MPKSPSPFAGLKLTDQTPLAKRGVDQQLFSRPAPLPEQPSAKGAQEKAGLKPQPAQQEAKVPVPEPVPLPEREPVRVGVPPPVPLTPKLKRAIRQRQPFDIYEDQYYRLKKIADTEKDFENGRGMSQMVRIAIDTYLKDHDTPQE